MHLSLGTFSISLLSTRIVLVLNREVLGYYLENIFKIIHSFSITNIQRKWPNYHLSDYMFVKCSQPTHIMFVNVKWTWHHYTLFVQFPDCTCMSKYEVLWQNLLYFSSFSVALICFCANLCFSSKKFDSNYDFNFTDGIFHPCK